MPENPGLTNSVIEQARHVYMSGYHCSEALVIAIADHYLGWAPEILIRSAGPLSGGVGGCYQETCGLLTSGALLLGVLLGRVSNSENDDEVRAMACDLRERFIATVGHSTCQVIRDRLPDVEKRCLPVVTEAAQILVELLEANAVWQVSSAGVLLGATPRAGQKVGYEETRE